MRFVGLFAESRGDFPGLFSLGRVASFNLLAVMLSIP
jgi:hypothetical protein